MTTRNWIIGILLATCIFQLGVMIHLVNKEDAPHNPIPYYCQSYAAMEQFQKDHPTLGLECSNL